jgi:hypothetical protein
LTPGQAGDCPQAEPLLKRVVAVEQVVAVSETEAPDGEQPPELGAVLADRGYDSDDLLKYVAVASLKAEAVIPAKKNRTVQRPLNKELTRIEIRWSGSLIGSSTTVGLPPAMKKPDVNTWQCRT